jgi:hypothetical protein
MFGKLKAILVIVVAMIPLINIALVYYLVKKSEKCSDEPQFNKALQDNR